MQTLDRPTLLWPDLSTLLAEQVLTGNADPETEDEQSGKLEDAELGVEPQPLQGGTDPSESGSRESETGSEGDGT